MSTTSSVPLESKSAKKRRAKAEAAVAASPPEQQSTEQDTVLNGTSGHDNINGSESAYLKELSKNIRNISKKLSNTAKADSVVEQNPGVSIEDLVAQKKLNADQKAQLLKKPGLQAQLAQLEDQHKHYQNFAQELEDKFNKEKTALIGSHEQALRQVQEKADAAEAAKESQSGEVERGLKVVTGFLHAAAAMRQAEILDTDEARAFEGALLLVYQGNSSSLTTLKNLVEGSEDKVPDVESNLLEYTFAQVKEVALKDVGALVEDTDSAIADIEPTDTEVATDPTIANAGLTELEDTNAIPIHVNGETEVETIIAPEQTSVTADAANAVAEASWDPQASVTSNQTPTGEDWVQVPRDPAETENGNTQPAAQQSTSNWADEAGAAAAAEEKPVTENDGFEQVRRERGGRGRGPRGRGMDGRGRGRGRGEGHRGRGGPGRGGRGGQRGGDRPIPTS